MRRATGGIRAIAVVLVAAAVQSCSSAAAHGSVDRAVVSPDWAAPSQSRWADSVLATLTLREKAGQMVWPSVFGDYVAGDSPQWRRVESWITSDKVGGFTISVGSPMEIAQKLNEMQNLSGLPLLFGADLEAGAGFRARGGYFIPNAIDLGGAVVFPPLMALGATRDTMLAYEQGRITAREGRALGMHIAYGPVLDVNNNSRNPVINVRAFGSDPALVSMLGTAFVRGVQANGMVATGKHFPGHGDTEVNSHLGLPVVSVSRERLDSVELVPFRAAVLSGLGAIMSFHGAMPALDPTGLPGTLSAPVIQGLLRRDMGFNGVVISDAMDMRGVLDTYGADRATTMAVAAGVDILIQPLNVPQTIDAVVGGVSAGLYTEARLDSSVIRILRMKQQMGLHTRRTVALDSVRRLAGDSASLEVARTIAERSITLVRDSAGVVPLARGAGSVLSISVARRADLSAGIAFNAELRRVLGAANVRAEFISAEDIPNINRARLIAIADSSTSVVLSYYVGQSWDSRSAGAPAEFVELVAGLGRTKFVLVSFGNPYLLQQLPAVPAYMIAWGGFPVSQVAAARALVGERPVTGRLPIDIPPFAVVGHGLLRR